MVHLNIRSMAALAAANLAAPAAGASFTGGKDFGQELQRASLANNLPRPAEPVPPQAVREPMREPMRETTREPERPAGNAGDQADPDRGTEAQPSTPRDAAPSSESAQGGRRPGATRQAHANDSSKPHAASSQGADTSGKGVDAAAGEAEHVDAPGAEAPEGGTPARSSSDADVQALATALPLSADSEGAAGNAGTLGPESGGGVAEGVAGRQPGAAATRAQVQQGVPDHRQAGGSREVGGEGLSAVLPTEHSQGVAEGQGGPGGPQDLASRTTLPTASAQAAVSALIDSRGTAVSANASAHPGSVTGEGWMASIDGAIGTDAFAPALGARISVLARDGIEQARLNVHPAELGPIAVRLAIDGTQVRVDMAADWITTRQALEQSIPALATALRDAGFTLAGGGVFQQAPQDRGAQSGQSDFPRPVGQDRPGDDSTREGPGAAPAQLRSTRGLVDLIA